MRTCLDNFCTKNDKCQSIYDRTYIERMKKKKEETKTSTPQASTSGSSKPVASAPVAKGKKKTERKKLLPHEIPQIPQAGSGEIFVDVWWLCLKYNTTGCNYAYTEATNTCFDTDKNMHQLHLCNVKTSKFTCAQKHTAHEHT